MVREDGDLMWKMLKTLEDISNKLDRLIHLNELSLSEQSTSLKDRVLGRSELRKEVYELCDGKRSVGEIAKVLSTSIVRVSQELAPLEKAMLVKSKRIGKGKYYERVI